MKTKKLLSLLLAIAMILSVTTVAYASEGSVSYIDAEGHNQTCSDYSTLSSGGEVEFSTSGITWVVVDGEVSLTKVTIKSDARVNLILKDNSTLNVTGGIDIATDASLAIYAQSTGENAGKLIVSDFQTTGRPTSSSVDLIVYRHGISCNGTLIINGGDIKASSDTDDIEVTNPSNTAVTTYGIRAKEIQINGGKVTATAGDIPSIYDHGNSYGIYSLDVAINGGEVKVTAGDILCPGNTEGIGICSGTITMSGGTLDAPNGFEGYIKVTGGTVKELKVTYRTYDIELSGGTFEKISIENNATLAELVKGGYGYVDENGTPVDIDGVTELTNVKVVEGDFPYSQAVYGAEVVTAEGKRYIETNQEMLEALTDVETVSIKLLKSFYIESQDVGMEYIQDDGYLFRIASPKLTIDLNGKNFIFDEMPARVLLGQDFTLADSSRGKNGVFFAYEVGNDADDSLSGELPPKYTISGGELCAYAVMTENAEVTVSGGTVSCFGGFAVLYGGLNVSDGTIDASTYVIQSKLNVTGGTIKGELANTYYMFENNLESTILNERIPQARSIGDGLIAYDSIVNISGGNFEVLTINTSYPVSISGGSFKFIMNDNEDNTLLGMLASGHAFYSVASRNDAESTAVNADEEYYLECVYVKEHTCNFGSGTQCACGRTQPDEGSAQIPENAIAKVVYREENGNAEVVYPTSIDELYHASSYIESITLLKDIKNDTSTEWEFCIEIDNVTIDLNGHTFDYGYIPLMVSGGATLTIKDSSEEKTGVFNTGGVYVEGLSKVVLESGTLRCFDNENIPYNCIVGDLEIRGGTFDFEDMATYSFNGRITVAGGTVKGEAICLLNAATLEMLSLDPLETIEEIDETTAADTGDSMLVTGGEILSYILVGPYTSLNVTGGEIGEIAESDEEYGTGIIAYGGAVYISGGKIAFLGCEQESIVELSGGTFDKIFYYGVELLDMLADNYAYYTKGQKGDSYNTVITPLTLEESYAQQVEYLADVQVKVHGCEFDSDGVCDCGRTGNANVESVSYLTDSGNTAYCNNYKLLTKKTNTLSNGWYVVKGKVTVEDIISVTGDVHIILTDGSTLTAKSGIYNGYSDNVGGMTVYAQSTGKNAGKLVVTSDYEEYGYEMSVEIQEITVNGGNITVNGPSLDLSDVYETEFCAVETNRLVINGGTFNAIGGTLTGENDGSRQYIDAYSTGVYAGEVTVNGGTLNAKGGKVEISSRYSYVGSNGINCNGDVTVNGGTIIAEAGPSTVNDNEDSESCHSSSVGIYAGNITVKKGKFVAKGDNATVTRPNGGSYDYDVTCSMGISAYSLKVSGGTVEATSANAKNSAQSGCSYAVETQTLYVDGGIVTLTKGKAAKAYDIHTKDQYYNQRIYIFDGAVQSSRPGGAISVDAVNTDTSIGGGSVKFADSILGSVATTETNEIANYLANGYSCYKLYDEEFEIIDSDTPYIDDMVYIARSPITVFVREGDAQGYKLDLSTYADDSAKNIIYNISDYDDEAISVTCDEDGIMTIIAQEGADQSNSYLIPVVIEQEEDMSFLIFAEAYIVDKIVPTVTLTKTAFEKTYDGEEFSTDALAEAATVTNGTATVEGTWYWYNDMTFVNVMNDNVTAVFVPDDSAQYAPVTVTVKVTVNQATPSGTPEYTKIDKKGKTLADAELTANESWPDGTLKWVDKNGGELESYTEVTSGTSYKWEFCPTDAVNYSKISGSIILWKKAGVGGASDAKPGQDDTAKDDDSTTNVTTDDKTGTVTETTKNPDGSTTVTETKTDGTVTTTETDTQGNSTTTTKKSDGSTTVEQTRNDGTTVRTETDENGNSKTKVDMAEEGETEVTIPTDNSENITSVIITDADGNKTEVTDFEKGDGSITVAVSGNCTVELISENQSDKKEFSDVHKVEHWAESFIDYVFEKGIMKGISEDKFGPDEELTRGMLVTVLYRLAGEPEVEGISGFEDVSEDEYFAKAVAWAKQNGIVSGISESIFAPNENITREQIVTIIYRFAKYMEYDVSVGESTNILSYTDFEEVSEYAIEAMQYAVGAGIIQGKTQSTLNPKDNATRAEIAAILQRFIEGNK